jgi:hypothetical protein
MVSKTRGKLVPSGDREEIRLVEEWCRKLDRVMGIILTERYEHVLLGSQVAL